ncbi:CBS domain-containing protein [Candidatus Nanohalococcus occultus]|uniref:CBS domain n=1 Tax=Candidatus Nanohalococcus occultus TaxID=2978047 RepID=A0ABY8CCT8_9ARCH|nr:CBS domain [Candidatus Nanohaloarchaeota archaeon SVXNc]
MESEATIKEVMTDGVIAVEKDKSVVDAAKILREEGIRGLVVVDQGEAVGVIVCRDLVYEVVSKGKNPKQTSVEEVMSKDLIVAEEQELLNDVAMAMIKNDISRVPVVRQDMLVGIVTQSDILRAWPGFAEIMEEKGELEQAATPRETMTSGVCEDCENYSEDVREVNGMQLCPECRDSPDQ